MSTKIGGANPNSQGASAATQNGELAPGIGPVEKSTLSLALARLAEPEVDDTQSASASSQEPPAAEDAPAEAADANLTEGETPAAEADEASSEQGENVLSQADQETQAQLAALAEAIKGPDGKVNIGEVKRIKDLLKEKSGLTQQLQALEAKVAELESGKAAEPHPVDPGAINPLANLKTEQDLRKAKRQMHEVLEFAEENPNGGTFRGQEFDEAQVRELRRDARRALDIWLPERGEQLAQETVFRQQQTLHRQTFLKQYPQFADPENPDAKVAATLAKSPYIQQQPNPDYIAAALAIGDRVLREQAAAKAKPPGKLAASVARAKPATVTTAGSNQAPRSHPGIGSAIDQVKKERSRDALANLFAKTTG